MPDILCLDTEPDTLAALRSAGHNVVAAPFGYRNGVRKLSDAPHDFDLIVCDLRRPACFDLSRWGNGGNSNYKCAILPHDSLTWESRLIIRHPGDVPKKQYHHRLIYETQIERMNVPSAFGPNDVRQAIALAGVPALIFLNPEWVIRTGGHVFPDFVGVDWETGEALATRFEVLDPLTRLTSTWDPALMISTPVRCLLRSEPRLALRANAELTLEAQPIVVDRLGIPLGELVKCGKGTIWLIPATENNAAAAVNFANNLDLVHKTPVDEIATEPTGVASEASDGYLWDLFISHASEDKPYTDDLYAALAERGVSVWYDNVVLTIGDSLRQKIDEGLAGSEFGVVVLSKSFFSKNWPKAELDALFGMQMGDGRKRILPIWHGVTSEDVAAYSPLLSTLYASNSDAGLAKNVEDILRAIGVA